MNMPAWRYVVVHHSAGPDTDWCEAELYRRDHRARGWADLAYHGVVELIGDAYQFIGGRPLNRPGAHCKGHNSEALGICLVGDFSEWPPLDAMLEVAAAHIAGWLDAFGLTGDVEGLVRRHRDLRPTACPGAAFPIDQLRHMVERHRHELIQEGEQ